ncbi:Serine recombinase PinE (fragment) [Enterobacterales bacterium 8AC]
MITGHSHHADRIYDQHLDLQRDALNQAGCVRLFEDTASGIKAEQRGFVDCHLIWVLDSVRIA